MPAERTCPRCGTALASDALEGLCPTCVGRAAFADAAAIEEAGDPGGPAPTPELEAELARLKPEEAGEWIGPYKLMEQIGQGGFGTVWVADQERPVRRRVALKIIKMGMDTKEVIARFEQERQALALMEHPHIAKVFDAGATQWGRPFFVMELVRGIKITEYCDQANLPTAERLALFIQVCNAVQHAHQKGIIHRDLKPSNILVTLHDGVAVPKVIDFGVAKATQQQRLSDLTIYTQFEQMIGTPLYMSPEQAEMSGLDIDTRSDIYSLGVLLYELLVGRTPFDPEMLMKAGLDEIRRVIREEEPPKPSTALQTMAPNARASVAQHRQLDSARMAKLLSGDLDWIVMKALEKERSRRYETANGFANDIQRHLQTEPILARPPSFGYRAGKFVRKHKGPVAAAAAVLLTLLGGLTASTVLYLRVKVASASESAQRTKAQASEQATRTEQELRKIERIRTEQAQAQIDLTQVDEWFEAGQTRFALAQLAHVARQFPNDALVAERLVRVLSTRHVPRLLAAPVSPASKVQVSMLAPDGLQLVTFDGELPQGNPWVRVIDARRFGPLELPKNQLAHVQFSPDRQRLAVAFGDSKTDKTRAILLDLGVWRRKELPLPPKVSIRAMAFTPDGQFVNICLQSSWTRWSVPDGRLVRDVRCTSQSAEFSADGKRLLTDLGRYTGRKELWDLESGLKLGEIAALRGAIFTAAAFSPDSQQFVTCSSTGEVQVWDAQTCVPVGEPLPHRDGVGQVAFSPDGHRLIVATSDQLVRVWDLDARRVLFEPISQQASVVSFSPEGLRFLTASGDGTVRVWSAHNGQPLTPPIDSGESVSEAMFSADGGMILTAGGFRVWDIRFAQSLAAWRYPQEAPRKAVKTRIKGNVSRVGYQSARLVPVVSPTSALNTPSGPLPLPLPEWLPEFLEALARLRLDAEGDGESVGAEELSRIWERLQKQLGADAYSRLARWLMADRGTRTVTPFDSLTVPQLVARDVAEDRLESQRLALQLDPTNGLASARYAKYLTQAASSPNDSRWAEAEFHLKRAKALAPADPAAWLIRTELLHAGGRAAEALAETEAAAQRFPLNPEVWNAKASELEGQGRREEALSDYDRAAELMQPASRENAPFRAKSLLDRGRLLANLGRTAQAGEFERAGRAMQRELADWPSWGGTDPGRNMYSAGTNLPQTFDPGQFRKDTETIEMATTRNVKWVAKLGSQSYGNVVVAGGKVFVGTNNATPRDPRFKDDKSILMCFDENTGAFLWQLAVPKLASGNKNDWEYLGITAAPTVVNDRVYLVTNRAEVVCLTTDGLARGNVGPFTDEGQYIAGPNKPAVQPGALDADIVWRFDLMDELGVFPHNASASALFVLGDVIYVNTGNGMDWTHVNVPSPNAPSFIALDRHTGKLLAEDDAKIGPRIFHAQWSSPSSGVVNGRRLVFFGAGDGWLYAFDARPVDENGKGILKTVWKIDCNPPEYKQHKYPGPEGPSEIMATPVFFRNRVYVAIGQDPEHGEGVGRLLCIDATRSGDVTESGVIWDFRKIYRSISAVSIDPASSLLFVADFSGFLYCLDAATGQQYWRHDTEAHIWGSTLVADGKVFLGNEDGGFFIFAATREKRLLGYVELPAPIYAVPIVANGALLVQTQTHLFCVYQGSNAGKAGQPALLPGQPNSAASLPAAK